MENLQFIMELLYWLSEGGDSEDREIQLSGFETSCGLFNLDAKDLKQSSAQEDSAEVPCRRRELWASCLRPKAAS
ncbi:colorectal neoplasia differentially expressed peptide isoform X2 [Mustela erminea]|uniref:colorectal neoplasia differentially expressed peptide isoform X2 n=1 Tax=Mustela erminea TaxID=36723 RepID=UPI001386EAC3|nr:colorectal neoplasia differentially expressed peptide isoform X2 [Mustela erminea]